MIDYFKKIGQNAWSFLKGMGVTLKYLFTPAITVQYPYEKIRLAENFRGVLAFHPDTCISCEMCVRACPSDCISLASTRNEETKKKELTWYRIDFARCHFCGLCEESCPTRPKSVHHTVDYELVFTRKEDFVCEWKASDARDKTGKSVWNRFLPTLDKV